LVLSRPPPPFTLQEGGPVRIQNPKDASEYKQNFLKRLRLLIDLSVKSAKHVF
jgi:hypothetical protein